MNTVSTTAAASLETGVYEDPVDGAVRFYGIPGQEFGPLNVKYQMGATDESFVTKVVKRGVERRAQDHKDNSKRYESPRAFALQRARRFFSRKGGMITACHEL